MNYPAKKLWLALLLLVAVPVIGLLGCSQEGEEALPSDPVEALKEVQRQSADLETTHLEMDMTMDFTVQGMDVSIEIEAEGDIQMTGDSPQDANLAMEINLSMLGQETAMEVVSLDGEYWMRIGEQAWEQVPPEAANLGLGMDPAAALASLDQAKNVQRLEDEPIVGTDTYHFGFVLDAEALGTPEMFNQLAANGQLTDEQVEKFLETIVVESEVWVGQEDLLPRKQIIDMDFEISDLPGLGEEPIHYDMLIEIRYSQLNEPVEIEAPAN